MKMLRAWESSQLVGLSGAVAGAAEFVAAGCWGVLALPLVAAAAGAAAPLVPVAAAVVAVPPGVVVGAAVLYELSAVRQRAMAMRAQVKMPSWWIGPISFCRLGVRRNGTCSLLLWNSGLVVER